MKKPRTLFLTLKVFSATGGIESVCKTLCKVLEDLSDNFRVLSTGDQEPNIDYIKRENFQGFDGNNIKFGLHAINEGRKCDLLILSHIHLLFFAVIIKLIKPSVRIILYAHGIEIWKPLNKWKTRFLKKHTEIWAVSKFTAQKVANMHAIPPENIHVLNNCLSPFFDIPKSFKKPEYLLKQHNIEAGRPILFTLSRLSSSEKYKGYDLLIDLMPNLIQEHPDLLYIIGGNADTTAQHQIQRKIERLHLNEHVWLAGYIEEKYMSDYFLLADCFILPSKKEGFGIVFIEAAACGCKIIGGDQDGSVDALLDGKLGELVNPDDEEDLSQAIKRVLSKKRSEKESKDTQNLCLNHFSFSQYKKNVDKLING